MNILQAEYRRLVSSQRVLRVSVLAFIACWFVHPYASAAESDVSSAARRVTQIIAHRGASAERPECTLAAIHRAMEVGATAVEVDVRTSGDGKLFILHDATLDRTTGGTGLASAMTLAELQQLDAGSWFASAYRDERIPTLIQVAEACRGRVDLLLDLKEQGDEYDNRVARVIRENGDPAKTIVGVRSVAQAVRFRSLLPKARQLALIPSVDSIEAFARAGVDTIRLWPRWLVDADEPTRRVRDAGKRLHLNGTMGDMKETLELLEFNPDSLSSDHPGRLKKTLIRIADGDVPGITAAGSADTCTLTLELVDAATGAAVPGVVQLLDGDGKRIHLNELLDRGLGLPSKAAIHNWFVLSQATAVTVPRGKLRLRGFSGLETEIAEAELDLTGHATARHQLKLTRFYAARQQGWQAANTHVHLKKTSKQETERYLIECSKADGLDVVYVSYLERPSEHAHYSTNNYTREQLKALSNHHTHFDHGEEHRHNFTASAEGYGHVMLLNIPELIKPVSIGPGITDEGTDGIHLRSGIDKARAFDGRIIWCHNTFGLEDIPNWLSGRLDANNIFDGGTHGSYRHSFYRYLNIGLRVPFSTGTDWFMYDFSRVYVQNDARLTPEAWLDHLANAESYITNGPLLEFSVDGNTLGSDVSLEESRKVHVTGLAIGRTDFQQLELVKNGQVVFRSDSEPRAGHFSAGHFSAGHFSAGHFRADLDVQIPIDRPSWLAVRTPPPSAPKVGLTEKTPLNEYGREIFSHSSAIFVDVGGKRIFDPAVARDLVAEMKRDREFINSRGKFADDGERENVLNVYDQAIEQLSSRIGQ